MGDPPGQDEESDRENHHETQPETPSSEATTALPDPRSDCRDILAASIIGGESYGAIPDSGGVIHACYANERPHTLHVLDTSKMQTCPHGTTAIAGISLVQPGRQALPDLLDLLDQLDLPERMEHRERQVLLVYQERR